MDDALLQKVKNTLLVILKTRQEVKAVAILAAAVDWDVDPDTGFHVDEEVWTASIALPSDVYAVLPEHERETAEEVIRDTLAEVTRPLGHRISEVRVVPELVDELSFTQEELLVWIKEAPIQGELVEAQAEANFGPDDEDIPY